MKNEAEIQAEARIAINEVLEAQRGRAAQRIKPELRKAFPFGPSASPQEKRIWTQMLKNTMEDLSQWPQAIAKPLIVIAFIWCSLQPALSAELFTRDGAGVWYEIQADNTLKAVASSKVPFKRKVKDRAKWIFDKAVGYVIQGFIVRILS